MWGYLCVWPAILTLLRKTLLTARQALAFAFESKREPRVFLILGTASNQSFILLTEICTFIGRRGSFETVIEFRQTQKNIFDITLNFVVPIGTRQTCPSPRFLVKSGHIVFSFVFAQFAFCILISSSPIKGIIKKKFNTHFAPNDTFSMLSLYPVFFF